VENSNKRVKLKTITTSKCHKRLSSKEPLIIQDKMFVVERKYRCPECHAIFYTQEFVSAVRNRSENEFKLDLEKFTPKLFVKQKEDSSNPDSQ
jgi:hypothetical protein